MPASAAMVVNISMANLHISRSIQRHHPISDGHCRASYASERILQECNESPGRTRPRTSGPCLLAVGCPALLESVTGRQNCCAKAAELASSCRHNARHPVGRIAEDSRAMRSIRRYGCLVNRQSLTPCDVLWALLHCGQPNRGSSCCEELQ